MSCKVSVVIPVYNVEKYLKECLDSLVCQTLKEIEIICVDDGSTDSSLEILQEYAKKDERFKIIQQKNEYAGVARNNGMKIATGEYLLFLDSDDFFDKHLCEKVYNQGKKVDADIVIFDAVKYDTNTKETIVIPWIFHAEYVKDREIFNRKDLLGKALKISTPAAWNKAFKKSFIEKEKIFFQSLKNTNDAYFSHIAMATAQRITKVNKVLLYYRVGMESSLQGSKGKNPLCAFEAYRAIYDELNRRGIYQEVEDGFISVAVSTIAQSIQKAKLKEDLYQIYDYMNQEEFKEMKLLDYPLSYYNNHKTYYEVLATKYIAEEKRRVQLRNNISNFYEVIQYSKYEKECSISVIIPIYNVEAYLEECLDSIVNQTKKDIEIICINDGSTDQSFDIVKRYAQNDNRFTIINQNNSGQSVARNHGIKEAKGQFIYFMDSDDILDLEALSKTYSFAVDNQLDWVGFNAECFGIKEEVESHKEYYIRKKQYDIGISGIEMFVKQKTNLEYRVSPVLYLTRKEIIFNNNLWFYPGIIHEDNAFTTLLLISCKRTGFISEQFYKRRYRDSSTMTSKKSFKNVYGYFCVILDIEKREDLLNDFSQGEKEAVYDFIKYMLSSARNIYSSLSNSEKMAYKALNENEKALFVDKILQGKEIDLYAENRLNGIKIRHYIYKIAEHSPRGLVVFVKNIFDKLKIPY